MSSDLDERLGPAAAAATAAGVVVFARCDDSPVTAAGVVVFARCDDSPAMLVAGVVARSDDSAAMPVAGVIGFATAVRALLATAFTGAVSSIFVTLVGLAVVIVALTRARSNRPGREHSG